MDCKYAYMKSGYILCEKMGKTIETDPRKLAHKMCPYQIFCRASSCQKLNPEWRKLCKLWKDEPKPVAVEAPAEEKAEEEKPVVKKTTTKKKTTTTNK